MLLFGRGFFFFFLSLPQDHSSTNTVDADNPSLSLHDVDGLRVRNSRHSTSSETLCVRKNLFVNRIVHDTRRS